MSKKSRARAAAKTVNCVLPASEQTVRWFTLCDYGGCALLLAVTVIAYLPAINGGFIWDDDKHITKPELSSFYGLWRIWFEVGATQQYYPLLHSAFWIEHRLWGEAVFGYHLTNVFLHALSACLVVTIMRKLAVPGAWLAGFIFSLHPVCVESVAWISEQKSTLSTVFYLSSALVYLNFDQTRRRRHYFLAMGLFVLALLSKTVTATLPAALLTIFWWKRRKLDWKREVLPLVPWFVLGVAAGLFTASVERKYIGAEGADFALPLLERFLLAGRVIWFYFGKLVWPTNLIFIYPHWRVDSAVWWQYLSPTGLLLFILALGFLARKHRGPLAGFLFFTGTLFPVMGFMNVYPFLYSYVADHFQYVASLGIIVPLASGLMLCMQKPSLAIRGTATAFGAALLMTLGALTWRQNHMYLDSITLYSETLKRNPSCWLAENNLGSEFLKLQNNWQEAIPHFKAALRLKPNLIEAHNNLGKALANIPDRIPEAIAHLEEALRLAPLYVDAHYNYGEILLRFPSRLPEAISQFETVLRIKPDYVEAHYDLGLALENNPKRIPEAISHFETVLQFNPNNAEAHNNLGLCLVETGKISAALSEYETAIRIKPDYADAHNNLGNVFSRMPDRTLEAIFHYEAALRINPNLAETHNNLGNALSSVSERIPEAIFHYQEAMRINPKLAEAHLGLGDILMKTPGRISDAISEYKAALRINPDYAEAHYNLGVAFVRSQVPGQMTDAIRQFEEALRLEPDLKQAQQMLDRLHAAQH